MGLRNADFGFEKDEKHAAIHPPLIRNPKSAFRYRPVAGAAGGIYNRGRASKVVHE